MCIANRDAMTQALHTHTRASDFSGRFGGESSAC